MNTSTDRQAQVTTMAREDGTARGSWVVDGTSGERFIRDLLRRYEDGDPEAYDLEPAPLSGEYADDPTPNTVYRSLGMSDEDVERDDPAGQLLTDYEIAFSEAFWAEVYRSAVAAFGPQILPDTETD